MNRRFFATACSALLLTASIAAAAPSNDECTSATALGSPPFSTSVDLTGATDNGADPVRSCSGDIGHHNVWFTFTAGSSGNLSVVSTAQLTLYTGTCGALVEAACGASGSMSVAITAGQTYVLEVSGAEAVYPLTATVCGDGIVSGPSETCDDGNLVNGDGCDDHCLIECPEDPCRCLPHAGKFSVVAGKVTAKSWLDKIDEYVQGAVIGASICAVTAKLSGSLDGELYLNGYEPPVADAILTSGVGTTAVRFKGYKIDKEPNPAVFIDGDVVTGGGLIQNTQYADISGTTDTSGTDPRVATCQQAQSELTTASSMLASLAPTQTLGDIVVAAGNTQTITVASGRQVVNVNSITLQTTFDKFGDSTSAELDFNLDPATTVLVVNVAKRVKIGEGGAIKVDPVAQVAVFLNFLPGASLKLKNYVDLYMTVLAPTTNIKLWPYSDDDGFGDLYTTKKVNLKGAQVYGYIGSGACD